MRTTFLLVTLMLLLGLVATPVKAETEQNENEFRTESQNRKKEMMENREARITERIEKKEALQEKFQENRTHVAEVHAERLEQRFSHYYTRLSTLAEKIQTRIDTAKAAGKEVGTAQTQLTDAKASLESAKTYGEQAVAAFKAIEPEKYSEQREQALAARDLANKARESFMTALKGMKNVVQTLIALKVEEE